ncbi:hypothetical protein BH683_007255 [Williamsia sp. 1138]|uniref:hypothetical protein n=1 Tax=Williamsia sp. 1138 TaxID=1903117 RepID=UPI000A10AFD7|nr:hypothetical protein [Williamsia sp. 1138]OZG29728.1 hypothetical protein BH683_007255 [Williamsia sp. 1138]
MQGEVTEDQVAAKWHEISPLIDRMSERIGDRDDFKVAAGSSLASDDALTNPYQLSHSVRLCMTAGVDHLHSVKRLVMDSQVLHVAAPFSLSRGALETFSAAFWMLHPIAPGDRIAHGLRWHAKNFNDMHSAVDLLPDVVQNSTLKAKYAKLYRISDAHGLSRKSIRDGYTSTAAVKYAEEHSSVRVLFPWQLCSGFAHGRPWAYLGASSREQFETEDPQVQHLRLTSSLTTVLYPALQALHLLQDVLKLFADRSNTSPIV